MRELQTIEQAHKKFPTAGSHPLLVTCNDLEDWVCKYDRDSRHLFNELLASEFAKTWGICNPEVAFIQMKREHVPLKIYPQIPDKLIDRECFGSYFLENTLEINNSDISFFNKKSFIDKLKKKDDFLKIALFDIWLANEDRNQNNYNLLLYTSPEKEYFFCAIDHVNIFNSMHLEYDIVELTEDDTIINSDLAKILFEKKSKLVEIVDKLVGNFYLCTKDCEHKLDGILDLTPVSWGIDKGDMKVRITKNIFSDEWKASCVRSFREFVQIFLAN